MTAGVHAKFDAIGRIAAHHLRAKRFALRALARGALSSAGVPRAVVLSLTVVRASASAGRVRAFGRAVAELHHGTMADAARSFPAHSVVLRDLAHARCVVLVTVAADQDGARETHCTGADATPWCWP